jgi:DNA-binding CsgD family transcriptional regulator
VLSRQRLYDALNALGALSKASTVDDLEQAVLSATAATVAADSATVTVVGMGPRPARSEPGDFFSLAQQRRFEELHQERSWELASDTRGGSSTPVRISDILSEVGYRGSSMYRELFRSLEIEHQVAFSLPVDGTRAICIAVSRHGRDFSDREVDELDALRRPMVALSRQPLRWGGAEGAAPPPDDGWRASAGEAGEWFVVEALEGGEGLTPREHEVLALVAIGLTDNQVARRLGISPRTVNKHLQHVYAKWATTNRTEASWQFGARR